MDAQITRDPGGRKTVTDACSAPCPIERGMRVIGGKWTGSILWHLKDGPMRFNDIARVIAGASKKMITDRLRHLEAHGLVRREVVAAKPIAVRYELTDDGRTALRCLDELRLWADGLPDTGQGQRR